jgi:hypothetical protein
MKSVSISKRREERDSRNYEGGDGKVKSQPSPEKSRVGPFPLIPWRDLFIARLCAHFFVNCELFLLGSTSKKRWATPFERGNVCES